MKYIDKTLQKEIQKDFFDNLVLSSINGKLSLNSSTKNKFFKLFPKYKIICEDILKKQPKFIKLNFVLKSILLDIDLKICKTCNKEIRYTSKSDFCCISCIQNDEAFKQKKAYKVHLFYENKKKQNPKPIDNRTPEQKRYDALIKSKQTLSKHRQDPNWVQEHKEKLEQTNLLRFGNKKGWTGNPNSKQWQSFRKKQSDRLWNTICLWKEYIIPLFDKNELQGLRSNTEYNWKCTKCGLVFKQKLYTTYHIDLPKFRYCPRCLKCYPKQGIISKEEISLANSIIDNFGDMVNVYQQAQINKSLIPPYEIDIVLQNKLTGELIGIEYNGIYIHSLENKYKLGYHLNKTILMESKNMKLIHIFSDMWISNKPNVLNIIKNHITNKYDFDYKQQVLILDRSLYNKCTPIDGYFLDKTLPPEILKKSKLNLFNKVEYFSVENCGYLIYKKQI